MTEKCENCYYGRPVKNSNEVECRRHAPKPGNLDGLAWWPSVTENDWCGEWRNEVRNHKDTHTK